MILSAVPEGVSGRLVEIYATPGPFAVTGQPDNVARETRVRVRAATLGHTTYAVTVPEHARAACDLAIAYAAIGQEHEGLILGELALNGDVREVRGCLGMVRAAYDAGVRRAIVPAKNWKEAAFAAAHLVGMSVYTIASLWEGYSRVEASPSEFLGVALGTTRSEPTPAPPVLVIGRGGLASARAQLPDAPPTLEIATIASAAGLPLGRAFRAPHHTCSDTALVGGGNPVRPGEVTIAHGGVLYLEDVLEFRRTALDMLGHALARGEVTIVREGRKVVMPARPARVIATCNACPCGFKDVKFRAGPVCTCSDERITRYMARIPDWIKDRVTL